MPPPSLPQSITEARALCPLCLVEAPAVYVEAAGRVELRRDCPEHGVVVTPFARDPGRFRELLALDASSITDEGASCCAPGTAGCGGDVTSRRCVTVLPITDGCNLSCAYCFASSGPGGAHRSLAELRRMMARALEAANGPTPLQLSGGEPTVHPNVLDVVAAAREVGFTHVEVNTNGIRLAEEPDFAVRLKEAGLAAVYLQFDAVSDEVYRSLRGRPLADIKRRAVAACRTARLPVILVPTLVPGANERELGPIVRFALEHRDVVHGVNIQPVRHFGRFEDDSGHLGTDDVARLLERETGLVRASDLMAVPCCSAFCYAATLLLPLPGGAVPLTRFVAPEAFQEALRFVGERRFMELLAGTPEAQAVVEDVACACGIPVPAFVGKVLSGAVFVSITGFMDAETADVDRMGRCCVRVVTQEGALAPFCGYYLTDAEGAYAWRQRHHPEDAGLVMRGRPS